MRVLFVCASDFAGPSEKQVVGFAQELARRGHEVLISIAGDLATAGQEGVDRIAGVSVVRHALVRRGPRVDAAARARVHAFAPTLIHAFSPRLPVLTVARAYAAATGAPIFVHFEDDEWSIARGPADEPLPRRAARLALRHAGRVLPGLWPYQSPQSERWVAANARGVDALTPVLAEHVGARLGREVGVVLPVTPTLGGGTAEAEGAAEASPAGDGDGDGPVVVYTGAVFGSHRADFELGLRALGLAQRELPGLRFVHAGSAAPRFDLPAMTVQAGMAPGSATFLGHLPFSRMPALLAGADVLMQPGAPTDFNRLRLPSKLQAYLASGTPTVTFATGFGELLEDRREVLKTHTDRPDELAERLVELLRDRELQQTLSEHGPRAAARLFSATANTDALLAHYEAHL